MLLFNLKNTNIFKRFCSELAGDKNLPKAANKCTSQTTKNCFVKTWCNASNDFEMSSISKQVIKKFLLNITASKDAGIDHIPAKFLKDGAEVLALPLRYIINWSIKLSNFPEECKVVKLKPIFKKGANTDSKNYQPISYYLALK